MNLWQVMEKYNRIIGTLINSTVGKNELPGKILSFNSDKLFSKQNKTATEESYVLLFYVYSVTYFLDFFVRDSQTLTSTQRAC